MPAKDLRRLQAALRPVGTGASRRARREGYVTAGIYGPNVAPINIRIEANRLRRLLDQGGRGGIFYIQVDAEDSMRPVMLKELQEDALTNRLLHVDFQQIDLDEVIRMAVPVVVSGTETLTDRRLLLEHHLPEVELEGRPVAIPATVTLDVGSLNAGQAIQVADLILPAGVSATADPEIAIVTCHEAMRPSLAAETEDTEAGSAETAGEPAGD